ncbi:hypothetical protein LL946_10375 [Knoellia locipacati]|uniref:hypothetical protein n=1 Tax=Knoellia locipacati TaxID=882824 RepID=UPI0038514820
MERDKDVCSPCLVQLSSPHERRLALQEAILAESEPLITVTHLLRLCRDEHRVLWEGRHEPESRRSVVNVIDAIDAIDDLISREGCSTLLMFRSGVLSPKHWGCFPMSPSCWWPTAWQNSSTTGSGTPFLSPSDGAVRINQEWATPSRWTIPTFGE